MKKTIIAVAVLAALVGVFFLLPARAEKPPFSSTPLGQPLSPSAAASDNADATKTPSSDRGGYPGMTRSAGTKFHGGLDDPSSTNPTTDIVKWTGVSNGKVTKAGKAYQSGKYLGYTVVIEMQTPTGVWTSRTLHHAQVSVQVGQTVTPGQQIAVGGGVGDQFASPQAGAAHVHWELRFNGKLVHPLTGELLADLPKFFPVGSPETDQPAQPSPASSVPSSSPPQRSEPNDGQSNSADRHEKMREQREKREAPERKDPPSRKDPPERRSPEIKPRG